MASFPGPTLGPPFPRQALAHICVASARATATVHLAPVARTHPVQQHRSGSPQGAGESCQPGGGLAPTQRSQDPAGDRATPRLRAPRRPPRLCLCLPFPHGWETPFSPSWHKAEPLRQHVGRAVGRRAGTEREAQLRHQQCFSLSPSPRSHTLCGELATGTHKDPHLCGTNNSGRHRRAPEAGGCAQQSHAL